jgi:LysR family transcriptional regulator, benzoate and cis,cis-muconate-responsive activator of ben and cat genes
LRSWRSWSSRKFRTDWPPIAGACACYRLRATLTVETVTDIAVDWVQRESFLIALYEGHPLCGKKSITLRDLGNEPMILYPNAPVHGLAQEVAAAFRAEGVRLRIEQEVEDVLTCIALVASRFGVCVTTQSAVNLRLPGVVYRPLRSTQLREIELSCLYRRDDSSPILQAFLKLIRASRAKGGRARQAAG